MLFYLGSEYSICSISCPSELESVTLSYRQAYMKISSRKGLKNNRKEKEKQKFKKRKVEKIMKEQLSN